MRATVKAASKYKGLGEAAGLIAASPKIKTGAELYFKISGRYFLNDDFNTGQWKGQGFFFRKYGEGISTRLYAFSGDLFATWKKAMIKSVYHLYKGKSIEDVLPLYIDGKLITEVKPLGVAGFIAPDGGYISE